ncbi:hypothetical protein Msil_3827 [Methylocella silvestris BL2]|uniref:Uncharacterized protein n=1 Tax=Methylocella silvestris (strain DSM 15510 / CIP 108128 / LMG 27833 / NCIMB 13906 / BL2) TaxID=395965 RepID=B8EMN0_METSB|nr:hypothetical protein Msil_3827 [Methylocella silvestris BL2]
MRRGWRRSRLRGRRGRLLLLRESRRAGEQERAGEARRAEALNDKDIRIPFNSSARLVQALGRGPGEERRRKTKLTFATPSRMASPRGSVYVFRSNGVRVNQHGGGWQARCANYARKAQEPRAGGDMGAPR